jgi:hypothetical protein
MPKKPKNHGRPWSPSDNAELRRLAQQNTPTRLIGLKLGRTESSIYSHASEEGIPLKPTNQSPYNRQRG